MLPANNDCQPIRALLVVGKSMRVTAVLRKGIGFFFSAGKSIKNHSGVVSLEGLI